MTNLESAALEYAAAKQNLREQINQHEILEQAKHDSREKIRAASRSVELAERRLYTAAERAGINTDVGHEIHIQNALPADYIQKTDG